MQTTNELDPVLHYIRKHIYGDRSESFQNDRRRLLYALTWPAAWLDSQALRMHSHDYQRMLMDKLKQIHTHGDPARYRAYLLPEVPVKEPAGSLPSSLRNPLQRAQTR